MKNKIKKIITTAVVSAVSLTAIGCGTNNNKIAKNINKSMDDFVSSINNLDYVETSSAKAPTTKNIGKIVETSASNSDNTMQIRTNGNHIQFLNNNISEAEIENTITIPSERTDNFNLFVLSSTPFVTFTSDDNESLNINVKFSTDQIQETSDEIESKINSLILKRSILMIYVNEIYSGNVTLSDENKLAINAYVNVIKENTSFLNGNRGMVKNQLSLASDLVSSESNDNLINYYIIKSGEALETRASKLDSTISAIDSIINIIEANLTNASTYYQTNLSGTYNNLISNIEKNSEVNEITESSTNEEIASKIACTLDFCPNNEESDTSKEIANNSNVNQNTNQLASQNLNHTNNQNRNQFNLQNRNANQNTQNSTQNNNQKSNSIINNNQHLNNQTQQSNYQQEENTNETKNNVSRQINTNQKAEINTKSDTEINNQNNNQNQNNYKRIPNSVRRRRNNNRSINSNANSIVDNSNSNSNQNNENQNNNISRSNSMDNETKTMRARRTPENLTKEEYTRNSNNQSEIQRATRVPYKSASTSAIR